MSSREIPSWPVLPPPRRSSPVAIAIPGRAPRHLALPARRPSAQHAPVLPRVAAAGNGSASIGSGRPYASRALSDLPPPGSGRSPPAAAMTSSPREDEASASARVDPSCLRPRPGPPEAQGPAAASPSPAPPYHGPAPACTRMGQGPLEFRKLSECEDLFDYVGSSTSRIRSSSKRDLSICRYR